MSIDTDEPRVRIVRAAATLLAAGGRDAVTTRAVEAAAGVQAPTIYRLFGDKRGLIDAVAEQRMADYVAVKTATPDHGDPVEVLRAGWRDNVDFGLANPALFTMLYGDPRPGERWPSIEAGRAVLDRRVREVAVAGRLAVTEERAIDLIIASAQGVALRLIGQPGDERDLGMLDDVLDGLMATITTDAPRPRDETLPAAANALRAMLPEAGPILSAGEATLLDELLGRLGGAGALTPGLRSPPPSCRPRTGQGGPSATAR